MTTPPTPEPSAEALAAFSTPRTDDIIANMASVPRTKGDENLRAHARQLERELIFLRSKMVCLQCGGDEVVDSGGVAPWGQSIEIPCPSCNARIIAAEFATLRARLERAEEDSKRLDWLLDLIRQNGTDGLQDFDWSNPNEADPMEEDDVILDRAAIDAAMSTPSAKPSEGGE